MCFTSIDYDFLLTTLSITFVVNISHLFSVCLHIYTHLDLYRRIGIYINNRKQVPPATCVKKRSGCSSARPETAAAAETETETVASPTATHRPPAPSTHLPTRPRERDSRPAAATTTTARPADPLPAMTGPPSTGRQRALQTSEATPRSARPDPRRLRTTAVTGTAGARRLDASLALSSTSFCPCHPCSLHHHCCFQLLCLSFFRSM